MHIKCSRCQVRSCVVGECRRLDEYISASVVDKVSGVNTDMSKCAYWCFGEKSFVVLIFARNILGGNFHHLKTSQIVGGMLRIIFSITCASVSERDRLLAPLIPVHPKTMSLLTMRGKQDGGGGLTKSSRGPEGKPHSPNSFHSSAVKQQLPLRLRSGETDSNYSSLFHSPSSLSPSLSARREPLDGKPPERNEKSSPPPPSRALRERRLPLARGEPMVVYFEWCAIMTVQQINVTQICGKWWNFRVIPCKLLILSGEVATQEACSTSRTHSNLTVALLCQNVWQPALL